MTLRAILFDRDGTLTDFNKTWGNVLYHMLMELAKGDEALARELGKLTLYDLDQRIVLPGSPILTNSPSGYAGVWAEYLSLPYDSDFLEPLEASLLEHAAECVSAFEDTQTTIQVLAEAGYKIGLATNGTEASAIAQLKKLGVLDHFCFVAGYDSGFGEKPAPGQLLGFAEHVGLKPQQIAMVGDSLHDMHAALEAGMVRVGITTGALSHAELTDHCDHLFDSLSDMLGLLGLETTQAAAAT